MLTEKQLKILAFSYTDYDAIICDGAVRSGKTSIMTVSFIDWAMRRFDGVRLGICGKTADSAIKNIIQPYLIMSYPRQRYTLKWRRSEKVLEVSQGKRKNLFEVFGGRDESSSALIQGRTLGGVFLDEVVLMPKSFVMQAIARCSVEGARLWFCCNPDSPEHWFYKEWILKAREKNALYLHFVLEDNPSLSEATLRRYRQGYSGVFYQRYILGEWTAAEGLVYQLPEDAVTDYIPEHGEYYISCDYGTMNPFSIGLWCVSEGVAYRLREFYYDGRASGRQLTDEEYYDELKRLAAGYPIRFVVVDPSAASFITLIKRAGELRVKRAKNDVISGIRLTAGLLRQGKIRINPSCKDSLREFKLYRWDEGSGTDRVIKENDHAMDDIRYFAATVLSGRQFSYPSLRADSV